MDKTETNTVTDDYTVIHSNFMEMLSKARNSVIQPCNALDRTPKQHVFNGLISLAELVYRITDLQLRMELEHQLAAIMSWEPLIQDQPSNV